MCRSWCSAVSLPHTICDVPALSTALCLPSLSFPSVGFHVVLENYAKCWNAVLPWLSSLSAFVLYSCLKIWGVFLVLFCLHNVTYLDLFPYLSISQNGMTRDVGCILIFILILCLPLKQNRASQSWINGCTFSWVFCCCSPLGLRTVRFSLWSW